MLDLLIVLAFVVYSVTAGFLSRKKASRGLCEYFLAGRTLRGWQAGTSMAATQFAADTPLLVTGLVATGGIFMLWRLWIYGLAFLLMGFLFAAQWRRSGVITDAELTEIRYSGEGVLWLRVIKAIYYGTVINCVVLAMVLVAAVGIAELFLPWHAWLPGGLFEPLVDIVRWSGLEITAGAIDVPPAIVTTNNIISIGLILIFTALYSMTGGLRSVVATDIAQFTLAMVGVLFYAWYVIVDAGGFGSISDKLTALYGSSDTLEMISFVPPLRESLTAFGVVIGLQWVFQMNADGTGYLAQRTMACQNQHQARLAGVVMAWLQILLRSLPWLIIAVGLLIVYPFAPQDVTADGFQSSRELTFVRGMNDLLPAGIRGLMLTGMLAALASTLDTHLNWGASYWSNDIYKRLINRQWLKREPGGHELVVIARLANVVILLIALTVMANLDSIQQAWKISLLFGAGVGSVLILRWVWERINLWSELAAMAVSIIVAPIWLWVSGMASRRQWFGPDSSMQIEAAGLSIMAILSTVAAIAAAYCFASTNPETLRSFYKRVKPAGFWRKTARFVGDDPNQPVRKLTRELTATLLAGLSLFFCLYGTARLLISHEDVLWGYPFLVLVVGIGMVPLWWRIGLRRKPDHT